MNYPHRQRGWFFFDFYLLCLRDSEAWGFCAFGNFGSFSYFQFLSGSKEDQQSTALGPSLPILISNTTAFTSYLLAHNFNGLGPWSSPLSLYRKSRKTTPSKITIGDGRGVCVVHNLEQSLADDGSKNVGVTCKLVLDFLKFQSFHGPSLSSSSLETINKNEGDLYLARFSFR